MHNGWTFCVYDADNQRILASRFDDEASAIEAYSDFIMEKGEAGLDLYTTVIVRDSEFLGAEFWAELEALDALPDDPEMDAQTDACWNDYFEKMHRYEYGQ